MAKTKKPPSPRPMDQICPRCTGVGDRHYLTCPTLRCAKPKWEDMEPSTRGGYRPRKRNGTWS